MEIEFLQNNLMGSNQALMSKDIVAHIFTNIPIDRKWTMWEQQARESYEKYIQENEARLNSKYLSDDERKKCEDRVPRLIEQRDRYSPRMTLNFDEINDYLRTNVGTVFGKGMRRTIEQTCQELFAPTRSKHEEEIKILEGKLVEVERVEATNSSRLRQLRNEKDTEMKRHRRFESVISRLEKLGVPVSDDIVKGRNESQDNIDRIGQEISSLNTYHDTGFTKYRISELRKSFETRNVIDFVRQKYPNEYHAALKEWFDLGDYIVELYNSLPERSVPQVIHNFTTGDNRKNSSYNLSFDRTQYPVLKLHIHAVWEYSRDQTKYNGSATVYKTETQTTTWGRWI